MKKNKTQIYNVMMPGWGDSSDSSTHVEASVTDSTACIPMIGVQRQEGPWG